MDLDPVETARSAKEESGKGDEESSRLGTWVAITVALLGTFLGLCQIKDDNIVQAMQQAQADKIDSWSFYQARNLREEIARASVTQLRLQAIGAPAAAKAEFDAAIAQYEQIASDQNAKKEKLREQAEQNQANYDALNYRDDQFDLSEALIAFAISLLALTALTNKRWLFFFAMLPTVGGAFMGLAGLMEWKIHIGWLAKLLS